MMSRVMPLNQPPMNVITHKSTANYHTNTGCAEDVHLVWYHDLIDIYHDLIDIDDLIDINTWYDLFDIL